MREESDGFDAPETKSDMEEKHTKIILEMDSIMSKCVEKGCKKEISLLIQLMNLVKFEGDKLRKWAHFTLEWQEIDRRGQNSLILD